MTNDVLKSPVRPRLKTKAMQIRVSDEEREALQQAARDAGMTQSDFVRLAVNELVRRGVKKP